MRRRTLTLIGLAVSSWALVACGGDSADKFAGQQHLVAQTLESFQTASKSGDAGKICGTLLSHQILARFSNYGGSCEDQISSVLKYRGRLDVTVKSVTIHGGRAEATVVTKDGDKKLSSSVPLVKERGSWRIAELAR